MMASAFLQFLQVGQQSAEKLLEWCSEPENQPIFGTFASELIELPTKKGADGAFSLVCSFQGDMGKVYC